jgi:hypothetical protein
MTRHLLIAALLAAWTVGPASTLAADEPGWQGWAFEMRAGDQVGWFGGWTPGVCERFRREAIAERPDARIGVCLPVTVADEPTGLAVWVVVTSENAFVAALTPDICEDDPTRDLEVLPVALRDASCRRAWLRLPV